jgi:hypothetical protein
MRKREEERGDEERRDLAISFFLSLSPHPPISPSCIF